ncbi:MAG: fumarylacetoacetase [Cytophagales bacterium]|nr:fumarylacetoacetase [Cytophagales bacterium]
MNRTETWFPVHEDSGYGLENLPYGIFSFGKEEKTACVRLGEHVVDLAALHSLDFFEGLELPSGVFRKENLNAFMGEARALHQAVRKRLIDLFRKNTDYRIKETAGQIMLPLSKVNLHPPVRVGDYTDFYSSEQHAYNVGCMFRDPEKALMPNWRFMPVGYHGRASTIVLSGEPVRRPLGQLQGLGIDPVLSPTKKLDFELEFAYYIGGETELGKPVEISNAHEHIFGFTLLNDWSARDIQKWEYVPLGPFLGKSFATTVSPWVSPLEALEAFRVGGEKQNPEPLAYLASSRDWNFDIELEVCLQPSGGSEERVCQTNSKYLYWDVCQQLAHHTVNGCKLNTGDLLASGTISGKERGSFGSMLEIGWNGERPYLLQNGETRVFLEDGDTVIMKGFAQKGKLKVELGELRTEILPAHE